VRIFLDANVLFSAAKSDGAVRRLVRLLLKRGHECWADTYVVAEARRNLLVKGAASVLALDDLLDRLHVAPARAEGSLRPEANWLPEKDRPVLAAAIHLRCDALVTGDRTHFGSGYGRVFGGVVIHSPRSLAEAALRDD
jgi:predicted nucleic acid-binding protein